MKKTKRWVSVLLAVVMVLSILPMTGINSFAETSGNFQNSILLELGEVCLSSLEIVNWDRYTGNLGDSRMNVLGEEYEYGNGNIGIDGIIYKNGFEAWIARWNGKNEISWVKYTYNLGGAYSSLTGKIGLIKSYNTTNFDTTVYFYNGETVLESYRVTNADYNKTINVNVEGVQELTILIKDNKAVSGGTSFALYDMFLDDTSSLDLNIREFNGHYYKLYDNSLSWISAKEYCEQLGGYLATATSENEQFFIESLVETGEKKAYWLGGFLSADRWQWVTGEPFDSYTNWAEGEPNNYLNRGENSLIIEKGKWNDQLSTGDPTGISLEEIGFICEWDSYTDLPQNSFQYKAIYDTKQYYAESGFYSSVSSLSDCVELYLQFVNNLVKDISPITLTATVSGSGLSFSRNSYQNTYTATFDSISAGKTVDDILMLFPYNLSVSPSGNTYTVTVTLESESFDTVTEKYTFTVENLATKSANEHISFASSNPDYKVSKANIYGNTMVSLKNDAEYKWSKYSSFDFKNYDQIVLADIMINVLNVSQVGFSSFVPDVLKEWKSTYKTLLSGITTIVKDDYAGTLDISETKIDKLLKKSKYTMYGVNTEDELYQTVLDLLGNAGNAEKITKVFATIDKTQQVCGFIKLGTNIIKDAVDWGNKISVYNAYASADQEFKTVMKTFADSIPDSEWKMKEAVNDYINYAADTSGYTGELLESFAEMFGNVTLDVFKSCIGKGLSKYLGIQLLNWIGGSIQLANGALLSSTAAFGGIQTAFGAFFTGATLGLCLSDVLCNNSGKSAEMSKIVAMSEFSPYVINTLNIYEGNLYTNRNDQAVAEFEYAFALHKATQSYIMEHTAKSLEIKRDSLIIKLFSRDDYDGLISDILAQKQVVDNLKCHANGTVGDSVARQTKVIAVKCPVDVFIYDANGNEVVRIVNNQKEFVADGIDVLVESDEKYIALPSDQVYSVKIVATDSGEMDYLVTEYDAACQRNKTVTYSNLPLTMAQVYAGEVTDENDAAPESYNLTTNGKSISSDSIISIPVTGIQLDKRALDLKIGEYAQLTATVGPDDATNKTVHWHSDDASIATVDENGKITPVSAGTVVIRAVTEDWGFIAECTVTVTANVLLGDVNGDGKVSGVDARWVLQASSGARTFDTTQAAAADVNGDGKITAVDARWILQTASGVRIL